jgi:hypothetical protein
MNDRIPMNIQVAERPVFIKPQGIICDIKFACDVWPWTQFWFDLHFELLGRDGWFSLIKNMGSDIIAFRSAHGVFAFESQFDESVRVRLDDLADFVACRTRINLDVIVNPR